MTLPEGLLWQRLRGSPRDVRFRRQHPVGPYVADFYCAPARLVVEVDGEAHFAPERVRYDARRDVDLRARGLTVVRVTAAEVLRDPDAAACHLVALAATPLHRASHGPLPRAGEEQEHP